MQPWRRIPFALLALWAMLLTQVPQTVWACPVTGRVDVAARVCLGTMAPAPNGVLPCAEQGGKCCKPLSVPPGQLEDTARAQFLILAAENHVLPVFELPVPELTTTLPVPHLNVQPPEVRSYLARFNNSPPPRWTQYRPSSLSGRAPPTS